MYYIVYVWQVPHPMVSVHNDGFMEYNKWLWLNDVNLQQQNHHIYIIRNINKHSIEEFKTRLSYESWDSIFDNNGYTDVDSLFNSFHII
jgi:hypothetical protein